jgi:acid phosphatase
VPRHVVRFRTAALVAPLVLLGSAFGPLRAAAPALTPPVPHFSHVVEVFLENESAGSTWENAAAAPNLAALKNANTYIPNFYGVGHASLDNYQAAFGAVQPTASGKADCLAMQYSSCIFPAIYPTIAKVLDTGAQSWKVYSEGETGAILGGPCLHAPLRQLPDIYQGPLTNGYATRHNPAPWFDSILLEGGNENYCKAHNPDLTQLAIDSANHALPTFSFVEPDTCHDGHDTATLGGCLLDPEGFLAPNGIAAADQWLAGFVTQLTSSPSWDANSILFVTFDEGASADTAGCGSCNDGSAGGRVGAVVIGGHVKPNFTSAWEGDHYGFLTTLEASLGLPSIKSIADPSIAPLIHDGDPGVLPLTDAWQ